jgi:hypothetical protein
MGVKRKGVLQLDAQTDKEKQALGLFLSGLVDPGGFLCSVAGVCDAMQSVCKAGGIKTDALSCSLLQVQAFVMTGDVDRRPSASALRREPGKEREQGSRGALFVRDTAKERQQNVANGLPAMNGPFRAERMEAVDGAAGSSAR